MTGREHQERRRVIYGREESDARRQLDRIHELLWPSLAPGEAWTPDTVDAIAATFGYLDVVQAPGPAARRRKGV